MRSVRGEPWGQHSSVLGRGRLQAAVPDVIGVPVQYPKPGSPGDTNGTPVASSWGSRRGASVRWVTCQRMSTHVPRLSESMPSSLISRRLHAQRGDQRPPTGAHSRGSRPAGGQEGGEGHQARGRGALAALAALAVADLAMAADVSRFASDIARSVSTPGRLAQAEVRAPREAADPGW